MSVRFHPSAVCTSICSEELFSVRTETMGTTEATFTDHNDFEYDEETLRTTGLVLAIVMFVAGILIALSNKCTKCVKSSSKSSDTPIPKTDVPPPAV
ncbi:phospholemman-like isoform X2 [Phyllopteryx taeniolatus]|uniref:phospholemman-like isoform X2 n=1 Tax=Phyllopteryx taeniolatus TaxID=161469 RepID=UPI002AD3AA52|nr:phospholemman-like isoform X2 [Phyllopteryx taeniolatus]